MMEGKIEKIWDILLHINCDSSVSSDNIVDFIDICLCEGFDSVKWANQIKSIIIRIC